MVRLVVWHTVLSCVLCLEHEYFFCQAEDGIRDGHVTGVQTCALPISTWQQATHGEPPNCTCAGIAEPLRDPATPSRLRSEERRVGKEGRSRGGADTQKKKEKEKGGSE